MSGSRQERLIELGAMIEMYEAGSSLTEVGQHFGVTRQAVYARLKKAGVVRNKKEAKAVIRERETARAMGMQEVIRSALRGGDTPTAVAAKLEVLPSAVRDIYNTFTPLDKKEIRYKGSETAYSDEELLESLRLVAEVFGGTPGVTAYSKYRAAWPELALPHAMTIVKRFDDSSSDRGGWSLACEAAGLTPNSRPAEGTGEATYDREDMDDALKLVHQCVGFPPSIGDYRDFMLANSWKDPHTNRPLPSPGTIMREYDGWINALRANFGDDPAL
jgi:hypothetical protein